METDMRHRILEKFELFQCGTGGLDNWLSDNTPKPVFDALDDLENHPLTRARMNQSLTLAREAPISDALFQYYWLTAPDLHPYDVTKIPCFDGRFIGMPHIISLDHLYWGLYRFYVDALLCFGNIRTAFQRLRNLPDPELRQFYEKHRIDNKALKDRGKPIGLAEIAKDNRYLISEMACKSFDNSQIPDGELGEALINQYREHLRGGGGRVTAKQLLTGAYEQNKYKAKQLQFDLSANDFQNEPIESELDLRHKIQRVAHDYEQARNIALANTKTYLSMVGDLDVYVATSMRSRQDFRAMADFCDRVFNADELRSLNLRYFDPTLSAAEHHEDKGLIECLMVKRAKVLVLQAGPRDSYGKDAEAAMALSLGKPVIIHADDEERRQIFSDVHPLSRLINFETGVAIGAMVAGNQEEVIELLRRIFENDIEYELDQPRSKYLVLKEKITESVVRLQTSDELIRETFWNHYHSNVR